MARLRSKEVINVIDSGSLIVSETAPSNPAVGQRWFRLSSSVVYQYTNDGTSSFWLDISSGGIGTSASRSVDIVANSDPHLETNPAGGVGTVYYNREGNRYFVCTDATSNANVWSGRYVGSGGVETMYKSGSDFFKVHSFLKTGTHTFYLEAAQSIDYLVVGGGGGGGVGLANGNAGGGGAGGLLTATGYSLAAGNHVITVGAGGTYSNGANGGNSSIGAIFVARGGGHGGGYAGDTYTPGSGNGTVGSAGGQGQGGSTAAGFPGTTGQGNSGSPYTAGSYGAGGGGGAGGAGKEATLDTNRSRGGAGGEAVTNSLRTGSAVYYAGGGAGSTHDQYNNVGYGGNSSTVANRGGGGNGKHNQATGITRIAESGKPNTGGGGGGGQGGSNAAAGDSGWGGSGIVVIRYQINP